MADALSADLELDIGNALSSVDSLQSAIEAAVTIVPDVSAVDPAISDAVSSADTTAVVDATGAETITADIDSAVSSADSTVQVDETGAESITGDIDAAVSAADATVPVSADVGDAQSAIDSLSADPIEVPVEADTTDAQGALDDLGSSATGAGSALDSASGSARSFSGTTGAVAAATGIAQGSTSELTSAVGGLGGGFEAAVGGGAAFAGTLGVLFHAGVEATGASERFTAILGPMATAMSTINVGTLNEDLGQLAIKLGTDDEALQQTAATLFQFAKNSGATDQEADRFGETLIALASRAVALNPSLGSVADVADQMSVRLARGGRFAASFGLDLNAQEIAARASADANGKAANELSIYEKAAAAAEIATEKYGNSLGSSVEQGASNAIIVQRRLREEFNNVLEAVGKTVVIPMFDLIQASLPVVSDFASVVGEVAAGALPVLTGALSAVDVPLRLVADAFALVGPAIGPAVAGFLAFEVATSAVPFALNFVAGALLSIGPAAEGAAAAVGAASTAMSGTGIGLLVAGLAAGAAAFGLFGSGADAGSQDLDTFTTSIVNAGGAIDESAAKAATSALQESGALHALGQAHVSLADTLAVTTSATQHQADAIRDATISWALHDTTTRQFLATVRGVDPAFAGILDKLAAEGVLSTHSAGGLLKLADAHLNAANTGKDLAATQSEGAQAAGAAAAAQDKVAAAHRSAADAARAVADGTKAVALEQDAANKTFDDAQRAVAAYAFGFGTAQAATDALKKADQELSAELDILFGRFLSADQATNNYKLAVVDLGDKLLANGFAFDDHSKAGLEDRNMLDDLASKASAAGKAIFDQTGNVEAAKGPLIDFRAHVQTLRDAMATAGQDTSFLDGMLATVDRAIAGINEKVPETHAAGKAHGHAVGDGSIEELPHSDDAGHQHGHRHAQAVHDTAPESGGGGQALGLAAVAGSLTELDNIFGAGQQHGAHHAEGINTLAGASLTEGANLGAQTALGSLGQLDNVTGAGATLGAGSAQGAGSQAGAHLTVGAGLGANVGSGVGSVGGLVAGAASFIAAQGASAAGGHRGDYAAAGAESAAGLADGIRSVVGDVVAAARSVAAAGVQGVKDAFNIHSPSRVMMAVGADVGLGLALGIEGSYGRVGDAFAGLSAASLPALAGPAGRFADGSGNTTVTFNVEVHGVTDPAVGRAVGEQVVRGAQDSLIGRNIAVRARIGG